MLYTYTQLEDYIKDLYTYLDINEPNNIDMNEIAFKLDIKLMFWDEKSEANLIRGKFYIWLNKFLSKQESWEEFGHELCHVLTHEGHQSYMKKEFLKYQEIKAENFSLHFCVPTFMLLKYEIANYYNLKDGISFITEVFNVTEDFARKRLIHFQNQIQQAISDEQHRKYMESRYPKAPPYSSETNKMLNKLNIILDKKKKGVTR